jgi:hypothetical protein
MVLATSGPLLTPPPSSSPPKTPFRSHPQTFRVRNLIHVGKIYFTVLFGSIKPSAPVGQQFSFFSEALTCASSDPNPRPPALRPRASQPRGLPFLLLVSQPQRAGDGTRARLDTAGQRAQEDPGAQCQQHDCKD